MRNRLAVLAAAGGGLVFVGTPTDRKLPKAKRGTVPYFRK
jgi:hypothetical protein